MSLRRLTGVDTAFLAAEGPGNPLHMMGVLLLDPSTIPGGYSFQGLRDFVADRLPALPPLRRRLVEVPGGLALPSWTEAGEIELDYHLRRVAVPSPGGARELAPLVSAMMERPLDRNLPLWEMQVVEGLEGGRIALLAKLSHAMMDGTAGLALMATLVSPTPEPLPIPPAAPVQAGPVPGPIAMLAGALPWLAKQPLRAARAGVGTARRLVAGRNEGGREGSVGEVPVRHCWLNESISPYREVAWRSFPLARLRALGREHDASINDVLLAMSAGALRRYAAPRDLLPDFPLVASVPMAVRKAGDERANAVSAVSVALATDQPNPVRRLHAIRDATAAGKSQRGSTLGEDLAAWAEVPPPLLFSLLTRAYLGLDLASRVTPLCNLVVSSVPGPPDALYFAGARLEAIFPLGPVFSGMTLNATAIGCGDQLHLGLVACRRTVRQLWELADGLGEALDELAIATEGASAAALEAGSGDSSSRA